MPGGNAVFLHVRTFNKKFGNKLWAGGRHNMPPPLSSLCGRRSASSRRADRACRRQRSSRFTRSIRLQVPDALTPRWVKRPGDLDLLTFWPLKWCPSHV